MSHKLINRSPDLNRLRDEGYNLEIRSGFLLVKDVPYVNSSKEVKRGTLVTKLVLAGDVTTQPDNHVAYFIGEHPCRQDGREIHQIKNQSNNQVLAEDVVINHTFSAKPKPTGQYPDYYAKVSTYVAILSGPAQAIDPSAVATMHSLIEPDREDDTAVFNYVDTASSRAEIGTITCKLELGNIAIVGMGGTGGYVLDLVAKTPVKQIHLYDGDTFYQHNAFRSPGAPSVNELRAKPSKAAYMREVYSKMHRGIVAHEHYIDTGSVEQLRSMDFVFLCLDRGAAKELIVPWLEEFDVPFVDVGMGLHVNDGSLGGIVRVTASTSAKRDHVRSRIQFSDGDGHNDYAQNIQIADLNALNAALAVIKWKKHFGFYRDLSHEHNSTYTLDGNVLVNEDCP
ncbi:MAG: hypothetical protein AMXMBFR82_06840 [Candidatus Hydrogenedentota bacterium]